MIATRTIGRPKVEATCPVCGARGLGGRSWLREHRTDSPPCSGRRLTGVRLARHAGRLAGVAQWNERRKAQGRRHSAPPPGHTK
jgi:hypothetical protein